MRSGGYGFWWWDVFFVSVCTSVFVCVCVLVFVCVCV